MNPFDLSGPWFLLFFTFLGVALLSGVWWVRRAWEPDPTIPVHLTDPYEIACLRGGPREVLRLATAGLIDRGLLKVNGKRLATDQEMARMIRNPLEKAILEHFWTGSDLTSMFARASLRKEGENYELPLQQRGLIADKDGRMQQLLTCLGAIGVLWVTAVTKVQVAIERGHSNYAFLIILTIMFTIAACFLALVRTTVRGKNFLADMQTLFAPLKQRASSFVAGNSTTEMLLMGAVFGVAALPPGAYGSILSLFPQAKSDGSGSSCGSSSCGSSSSSCGGGGCGGGGCGGCGS